MNFLKQYRMPIISRLFSTISNANVKANGSTENAPSFALAISIQPELKKFHQSQIQQLYDKLVNDQGFTKKNFHNIIIKQPSLIQRNPQKIHESLECWRSTQFGDKHLFELFEEYPEFLEFTDENYLRTKCAHLQQYAITLNNVWRMFLYSPNVLIDSQHIINAKINYFNNVMRVDSTDVTKSTAFAHDLKTIEIRHVFLERLGLYKKRSLKADPLEQSKNPRMNRIMDTSDEEFAEKVCVINIDEFEVFKELYEKEMKQRQDKKMLDDYDDDDDE